MVPRIRLSENHQLLSRALVIVGHALHHAGVATYERIYRCTETGREAWANEHSGLPEPYRRILGVIQGDTRAEVVFAALHEHPAHRVLAWLDEIETLRFVKSAPVGAQQHLELTGGVSVAALYDRYKADQSRPA